MEEIIYIYSKSVETTYLEEMEVKFPVSFKYAYIADKEKR